MTKWQHGFAHGTRRMSCPCPDASSLDCQGIARPCRAAVLHSQDKPPAAERQVELILAAVTDLARFPHSGRPGRRAGTRELVVGQTPYLVPYRVRGDLVEVLRVL